MQTDEITIETGPQRSEKEISKIVADQNDRFRKTVTGTASGPNIPQGRVVMTRGVSERGEAFCASLIVAVGTYEDFNADCDPYGWHEMGVIEIEGEKLWFKIDLYDENYEYGSSDPTNPRFTRRVLTLLFPSEY
jgi:hypothetical protein